MPLIDTPVAELEYLEDGDPAGTPVVLVHGFPDIPATWEQVVPRLPPGLRIIRPYLRGYGGSRVRPEAWDEAGGAQVAALATDCLTCWTGSGWTGWCWPVTTGARGPCTRPRCWPQSGWQAWSPWPPPTAPCTT